MEALTLKSSKAGSLSRERASLRQIALPMSPHAPVTNTTFLSSCRSLGCAAAMLACDYCDVLYMNGISDKREANAYSHD
jgi:hypothetical protein